ncbi:DUF1080 domain-containing protein [Gemmata sp. JC673]|uniref:DUF1080 domain-containing protein n=1 Tax=Gemmata algarum TaxID=2975278 RepID=A0ABU5F9P8_9BACT|nr:DUF1080 domain-containing protein [Gemmata algarum]MDY3562559.1 DUF1080 domain-containing protein [Gemmata algarum]
MQSRCLSRPAALVALVAAVALASAAPRSARAADDEWVQLFNGKDLTGWKIPNPPTGQFKGVKEVKNDAGKVTAFVGIQKDGKEVTLWQVKDGMIVGGGPASHIFTEIEADNFHYKVEAKINDKGNSGQYFRTKFEGGFPAGYEAQINATHTDQIRTGSLYPDGRTKLGMFRKDICVMKDAPHKADEFFTQEVIAEGNHIQIIVNGKKTVDFKDPNETYKKGHFALQGHDPGSVMTFKKVEYKPIKK